MIRFVRVFGLAGLAALLAASASARQLHWSRLDVRARLEADGRLRVVETQKIVFDGNWNGGERRFRIAPGQAVEIERIVRVDEISGEEVLLHRGGLDRVDHWSWRGRDRVRWRSRLPSDPPFREAELVYRLETTYRGILVPLGERRYRLDHDFAFPDRDGRIERFDLELELAAEWRAKIERPARFAGTDLEPGRGFVVRVDLEWRGDGSPDEAVPAGIPGWQRLAALVVLGGWVAWRAFRTFLRDRALGRFDAPPDPDSLDREWLEKKVFSVPPEVVGAAWDRSIGSAEVAALVARLVAEGRIEATVEPRVSRWGRDGLRLRLLVPRDQFTPDERRLLDGLFPRGDEIDTRALRQHYRSRGFNPVERIRSALEKRVRSLSGFESGSPKPTAAASAILFLLGAVLLVATAAIETLRRGEPAPVFLLGGVAIAAWIPGAIGAAVGQRRLGDLVGPAVAISISLGAGALALATIPARPGFPLAGLAGGLLLELGLVRSMFNVLATREGWRSLDRRRELAAARERFRRELLRAQPNLDDRWSPWLVAFGLAPAIERWFHLHAIASGNRGGRVGVVSAVSAPTAPSWTGGGGGFGGAGTTASFATAVTTLAAGVPSPSSSRGSGGGGGGGGSSGGGGGGGW